MVLQPRPAWERSSAAAQRAIGAIKGLLQFSLPARTPRPAPAWPQINPLRIAVLPGARARPDATLAGCSCWRQPAPAPPEQRKEFARILKKQRNSMWFSSDLYAVWSEPWRIGSCLRTGPGTAAYGVRARSGFTPDPPVPGGLGGAAGAAARSAGRRPALASASASASLRATTTTPSRTPGWRPGQRGV